MAQMIPVDVVARLPEAAATKLQLIDGLAADALDASRTASQRLNDLSRVRGMASNPNIPRLGGIAANMRDRHQALFDLAGGCVRWTRALDPSAALEPFPVRPPELNGESAEEAVMRLRAKLAQLVVERLAVKQAPPLKAGLREGIRPFVAELAANAAPRLRLERGLPFAATFTDAGRDFGPSESFIAGLIAWLDPDAFAKRLEAMVDQLPERNALSDADQAQRLATLDAEIEALERVEEAHIEAAFPALDILRRGNASPPAVLGVRVANATALPAPHAGASPVLRPVCRLAACGPGTRRSATRLRNDKAWPARANGPASRGQGGGGASWARLASRVSTPPTPPGRSLSPEIAPAIKSLGPARRPVISRHPSPPRAPPLGRVVGGGMARLSTFSGGPRSRSRAGRFPSVTFPARPPRFHPREGKARA